MKSEQKRKSIIAVLFLFIIIKLIVISAMANKDVASLVYEGF